MLHLDKYRLTDNLTYSTVQAYEERCYFPIVVYETLLFFLENVA